ncbi:MAG: hypothetical protein ACI9N1_002191 [Flavobacteriales bacterium]|jgi:hypothetical protein
MEWNIPMTIRSSIGIIIHSTSNIMLALDNEISQLIKENSKKGIIELKLSQLKRVSIAIIFQYIGVILFLTSGLIKSVFSNSDTAPKTFLTIGVFTVSISIILLLIYSVKAVSIRQKHLTI